MSGRQEQLLPPRAREPRPPPRARRAVGGEGSPAPVSACSAALGKPRSPGLGVPVSSEVIGLGHFEWCLSMLLTYPKGVSRRECVLAFFRCLVTSTNPGPFRWGVRNGTEVAPRPLQDDSVVQTNFFFTSQIIERAGPRLIAKRS